MLFMVEAIIFSCSSGTRYRNIVLATKTNVTENRFRLWSLAVYMATPRGTRFRSSPLQEAENAVIRREFFVGLGTLALRPSMRCCDANFRRLSKPPPLRPIVFDSKRQR